METKYPNYKVPIITYIFWVIGIIILLYLTTSCAITHPADKKFTKEVVNSKNYNKVKIKNCNNERI